MQCNKELFDKAAVKTIKPRYHENYLDVKLTAFGTAPKTGRFAKTWLWPLFSRTAKL